MFRCQRRDSKKPFWSAYDHRDHPLRIESTDEGVLDILQADLFHLFDVAGQVVRAELVESDHSQGGRDVAVRGESQREPSNNVVFGGSQFLCVNSFPGEKFQFHL